MKVNTNLSFGIEYKIYISAKKAFKIIIVPKNRKTVIISFSAVLELIREATFGPI